jgi:hypothetical protein
MRQQLQANARWLIGLREEPVDFGLIAVSSDDCTDCHQRPADRHPIYRFFEPRFSAARAAIAPHRCLSCHEEHTGRRVTIQNGFCRQCHDGLKVPNDPIDPTHEGIAAVSEWNACLRCHDFHGSHTGETPISLLDAIPTRDVESYFEGGPSPWPEKRVLAKETRFPR